MPGKKDSPNVKKKGRGRLNAALFAVIALLLALNAVLILGLIRTRAARAEEPAAEVPEERIVLFARCDGYPESDAFELELTVRVAGGAELAPLEILRGGDTLLCSLDPSEFPQPEEDGGFSVSLSLTVPEAVSGTNAEYISARMGSLESEGLLLYRDVTVTEEMAERLCITCSEVSDEVSALIGSYPDDAAADGELPDDLCVRVLELLEARGDVAEAWIAGDGLVRFTTVDGLGSGVELRLISSDPEKVTLGSSASPAGAETAAASVEASPSPAAPGQERANGVAAASSASPVEFDYDESFRAVALDPDVLVLCPMMHDPSFTFTNIYTAPFKFDDLADRFHKDGLKVSEALGGECLYADDGSDRALPLRTLASEDLCSYGTVMIMTHGANETWNGSVIVDLLMYSSKEESSAGDAWDEAICLSGIDPKLCYERRYYLDGGVISSPADIQFRICHTVDGGPIFGEISKYYTVVVTTRYISSQYSGRMFPNTVILFNACEGFNDEEFRKFFMSHGGAGFFGFTVDVVIASAADRTDTLLSALTEQRSDYYRFAGAKYKSVAEAMDFALKMNKPDRLHFSGNPDFVYAGCGTMGGVVLDYGANPVPGAKVYASRWWNGRLQEEEVATTDSDGRYVFDRVPWGMYMLRAEYGSAKASLQVSFAVEAMYRLNFSLDTENAFGPEPEEFIADDYLGRWYDTFEENNTLRLYTGDGGEVRMYAEFYRIAAFDAAYYGERDEFGRLIFRSEDGEFVCYLTPSYDELELVVESRGDYGGAFGADRARVYRRPPFGHEWLGTFMSDSGETLEIYDRREDCILLVYRGYTASGEDMFTSYYTLYFDSDDQLSAAESDEVLAAAGWRYRLLLQGDTIIMESRYPDKLFYRQSD